MTVFIGTDHCVQLARSPPGDEMILFTTQRVVNLLEKTNQARGSLPCKPMVAERGPLWGGMNVASTDRAETRFSNSTIWLVGVRKSHPEAGLTKGFSLGSGAQFW